MNTKGLLGNNEKNARTCSASYKKIKAKSNLFMKIWCHINKTEQISANQRCFKKCHAKLLFQGPCYRGAGVAMSPLSHFFVKQIVCSEEAEVKKPWSPTFASLALPPLSYWWC